jgi:ubiquitin-conjugating enzyme E2 variant
MYFCCRVEPRTFKLYEELEKGEKSTFADPNVSYGLDNTEDQSWTNWNGTIVGPMNTNFDNRIYFLSIVCGEQYPEQPPQIKFNSKINLPCVNQSNGTVDFSKNNKLRSWNGATDSLETCLLALMAEMKSNKGLKQPADGDMY